MEFENIAAIIADVLNIDPKEVKPDTDLVEDIGADSLDIMQILMLCEDEFGVTLPEDEEALKNVKTVEDALKLIKEVQ